MIYKDNDENKIYFSGADANHRNGADANPRNGADANHRNGADANSSWTAIDVHKPNVTAVGTTANGTAASGTTAVGTTASNTGADSAAASGVKRRRRGLTGRIALVVLLVLTICLIIGATPHFSISKIEVSGNQYYNKAHLITKSGLQIGQNGFTTLGGDNIMKILSFRCSSAEKAVASACPYVKSIQVKYVLPDIVRIEIEERSKSVVIPYFESGLLIDGEGVVVDIVRNYRESELPVVLGLPVANYEIGVSIPAGESAGVETLLSIVNALRQVDRDSSEALSWEIATIDIRDQKNIMLGINGGIDVNLGDGTDVYYRVSAVKEILSHGIKTGEKGVIIFSNGARPVFVPV